MNKELARTLTIALINYIDENGPEGTMDCSSGECVSLENAFVKENFDSVETLINKKLSRLTEFEQEVSDIVEYCKEHGENVAFDYAKRHAKALLEFAKKQLLSYADESNPAIEAMADLERTFECNPDKLPLWLKNELTKKHLEGYTLGKEATMREMSDFLKSHFNSEEAKRYNPPAINVPTWTPPCYKGGPCTNPSKDCINCPRANVVISPNTASGTSTATLHGNTSATDNKEHNPSFMD